MSKILDKLADQHEQRIIDVLIRLEEDVVREVTRATGGKLVSQRLAIQLQPAIRNLVETTFLDEADTIINEEYNKIAKEVLDTFGEMPIPKKFKKPDRGRPHNLERTQKHSRLVGLKILQRDL